MLGMNSLFIGLDKPLTKLSYEVKDICDLYADQRNNDNTNYGKIVFITDFGLLERFNDIVMEEMGDMKYIYEIEGPGMFYFDMTQQLSGERLEWQRFEKWFFEWLIGIVKRQLQDGAEYAKILWAHFGGTCKEDIAVERFKVKISEVENVSNNYLVLNQEKNRIGKKEQKTCRISLYKFYL